jgi:hypothetical protein
MIVKLPCDQRASAVGMSIEIFKEPFATRFVACCSQNSHRINRVRLGACMIVLAVVVSLLVVQLLGREQGLAANVEHTPP